MFRVIVLGGASLVDCGARTDLGHHSIEDASPPVSDAAEKDAPLTFPQETGLPAPDASPPPDASVIDVHFPGEANVPLPDSGKL